MRTISCCCPVAYSKDRLNRPTRPEGKMMSIVLFRTPGAIPLDAFNTFGVNHKPQTATPFGYFGTGLKYAVSVILRNGGTIRVFIKGVEYNFYVHTKDFRGKDFAQVRMRKRRRGMTSWMKSEALPFTTELGKNWKLWEAYREIESNTRDENGESCVLDRTEITSIDEFVCDPSGTDIVVECEGFAECVGLQVRDHGGKTVHSAVFLDTDNLETLYDCPDFTIYEGANDHFYYQGIRVYDLRAPSRVTYNFKAGRVQLSEDRTPKNIWSMTYDIGYQIQKMQDSHLIETLIKQEEGTAQWFETDDLSFSDNGGLYFQEVARLLQETQKNSRSIRGWYGTYGSSVIEEDDGPKTKIEFLDTEWELIIRALQHYGATNESDACFEIVDKIRETV